MYSQNTKALGLRPGLLLRWRCPLPIGGDVSIQQQPAFLDAGSPNHVEPFHFTSGSGHCGAGVSFPSPPASSGRASRALAARQQMAVNPVLPSRIGRPKPCHSEIDPYTSAARIPRAEPTCRRQGRPWSVPLRDSVVRSRSPRVCLSAARPSVRLVRSARAPQHLHLHAAQPFSTCPERR